MSIRNKISKSLYSLNHAEKFLSPKALKMIYYAIIHTHLLYCLPVIFFTIQSNIGKLYIMQNKSIRIISQAKHNAHTLPLFVHNMINQMKFLFMFNLVEMPLITMYLELYRKIWESSLSIIYQRILLNLCTLKTFSLMLNLIFYPNSPISIQYIFFYLYIYISYFLLMIISVYH